MESLTLFFRKLSKLTIVALSFVGLFSSLPASANYVLNPFTKKLDRTLYNENAVFLNVTSTNWVVTGTVAFGSYTSSSVLYINSTGGVVGSSSALSFNGTYFGIGTSTPSTTFDLVINQNEVAFTPMMRFSAKATNGTGRINTTELSAGATSNRGSKFCVYETVNGVSTGLSDQCITNFLNEMRFSNSRAGDPFTYYIGGTEKARFNNIGLSIGTTTQREALTVNGNGFFWNTATGTTSHIVRAGASQSLSVVPWITEVQLNDGTRISGVRADGLTASEIFSTQDIVTAAIAQAGEGYANGLNLYNSGVIAWSNLGFWYQTKDTGISRGATGTVFIGNGNQGSATGTLIARNIGVGTTTPIAHVAITGSGSDLIHAVSSSGATFFRVTTLGTSIINRIATVGFESNTIVIGHDGGSRIGLNNQSNATNAITSNLTNSANGIAHTIRSGGALTNESMLLLAVQNNATNMFTVAASGTVAAYDNAGNLLFRASSSTVTSIDTTTYEPSQLTGLANVFTIGSATKPGVVLLDGGGIMSIREADGTISGQYGSNAITLTSGSVSSTYGAQRIKLAASPFALDGLFFVNDSGNTSVSGTLRVFGKFTGSDISVAAATSTRLYVDGATILSSSNITASTSLSGVNNQIINITSLAADINVYLPTSTSPGQTLTIADNTGNIGSNSTGGFVVTIFPTSTDKITGGRIASGNGAVVILDPKGTATFVSDGAGNWRIIGMTGAITAPWSWAGISIWLESDKGITLTGASSSKWADVMSTSSNFLAQSTATLMPLYFTASSSMKGRPSLWFNGTTSEMSTGTISGMGPNLNGPTSMGGVYQRNDMVSGATFLSYGATTFQGIGKNTTNQTWWYAGTGNSQPSVDWSNTSTHSFVRLFSGVTSTATFGPAGATDMFVDDQFHSTSVAGGRASNATSAMTASALKIGNGLVGYLQGEISVVWMFNRRLTFVEGTEIYRYQMAKYVKGITMPN